VWQKRCPRSVSRRPRACSKPKVSIAIPVATRGGQPEFKKATLPASPLRTRRPKRHRFGALTMSRLPLVVRRSRSCRSSTGPRRSTPALVLPTLLLTTLLPGSRNYEARSSSRRGRYSRCTSDESLRRRPAGCSTSTMSPADPCSRRQIAAVVPRPTAMQGSRPICPGGGSRSNFAFAARRERDGPSFRVGNSRR
jgi:hypothetical protein